MTKPQQKTPKNLRVLRVLRGYKQSRPAGWLNIILLICVNLCQKTSKQEKFDLLTPDLWLPTSFFSKRTQLRPREKRLTAYKIITNN